MSIVAQHPKTSNRHGALRAGSVNPPDAFADVPEELRARPQWVCWGFRVRDGNQTKVPFQTNGTCAETDESWTWTTFELAVAAYAAGDFDGIGYVLAAEDPYVGIDFDKALDAGGMLKPWAAPLYRRIADGYAEVSPSGTGIKVWATGAMPEGKGRKRIKMGEDKTGAVEMYDRGRFFTVTGRRFQDSPTVIGDTVGFPTLFAEVFPPKAQAERKAPAGAGLDANDATLIDRAKHAGNGPAFSRLWAGDTSDHAGDDSSADLALCNMLAFWTGGSRERIDRLFRQSGLYRDKWERSHYRDGTIGKAIDGCNNFYDPRGNGKTGEKTAEAGASVGPTAQSESPQSELWPDPQPLPAGLPPVMPFDFGLLPASMHGWVQDISDRMQCPPDYCAATAMIVAGVLIGRKVAIRPKRLDDWQVVPNLFGAMVGRPSLLKSPAMKEMLKFLARLEGDAKVEYAELLAEHEAAGLVREATLKVKKDAIKQAVKDGGDAQAIAQELVKGGDEEPVRRRYIANDTTVEKLGMILAENPNGILLYVDELISLLRTMDREGHEGDRGFYLTAWAGDSRYTYDRIGRGTLDIEAAIVSIVGSIQPGVIADYLRGAIDGGAGDDGLIQRFQMTVWPDLPPTWRNIDRYPDADAKAKAHAALQRLADLAPTDVEAERDNYDRDAVPFLRFDRDGQALFDSWRADLEGKLRRGSEHPAVECHLAKYRSLIPSLALILHLLDGGVGPVTSGAAAKAIGWGCYLASHARRLYAGVAEAPAVAARLLATRIQGGDVSSPFAARDVYRMGWAGLDRERTESAIDVLLSLGWIEERLEPTAGRAKTRFVVNPKIEIH